MCKDIIISIHTYMHIGAQWWWSAVHSGDTHTHTHTYIYILVETDLTAIYTLLKIYHQCVSSYQVSEHKYMKEVIAMCFLGLDIHYMTVFIIAPRRCSFTFLPLTVIYIAFISPPGVQMQVSFALNELLTHDDTSHFTWLCYMW